MKAGGWNEDLKSSQEVELMFRMLKDGTGILYDNSVLTQLRAREGSISFEFDEVLRIRHLKVRGQIIQYLKMAGLLVGQRKSLIYESVFKRLRGLYDLDPHAAVALRRLLLPRVYAPPVSSFNTLPYVISMRLFGFRGAEFLRKRFVNRTRR